MFLLKVFTALFKISAQLPSPLMNIDLLFMCNSVLLNLYINTVLRSPFVEYSSVSYNFKKDLL